MSLPDLVIVTGAGRGIGHAIALSLAKKNIFVLCISKSKSCFNTSKSISEIGGKSEAMELDLSNYNFVESEIAKWFSGKSFKKIGIVLAAAVLGDKGPLLNTSLDEWDNCHKINVLGNLAVVKSALPLMMNSKNGKIVFFAGGGAAYPNTTFPGYAATKTSIVRIAENLHEELKDKGDFSVVCLAPGAVNTDMLSEFMDAGGEVRTTVDISEPASFVCDFLLSDKCTLSGSFVHVRDKWKDFLNTEKSLESDSMWKLRRIE